jgi:hypothetical protein
MLTGPSPSKAKPPEILLNIYNRERLKLDRLVRKQLAEKRLLSVIARHGIAAARTLEQKISDAGPSDQRIDPHILTGVRNELVKTGELVRENHHNAPWFRLGNSDPEFIAKRFKELSPVYQAYTNGKFAVRVGQALEIATYRALSQTNYEFFGRFKNLDAHDDSSLYEKEEPPQHIGTRSLSGNQRLDFLVRHPDSSVKALGLECKNVREWLYPDREEVIEVVAKCLALDAVPVLIGRRIPFVTFKLLSACGVILHQIYNQLVSSTDTALAEKARDKTILGYHDIRLGNDPDARLLKFICNNMFSVAIEARARFDRHRDLLEAFVTGEHPYSEFAARLRRRLRGQNEDNDWQENLDQFEY